MILLATIWHTGTQYAMQHLLPEHNQIHCNHPALWDFIAEHDGDLEIHTTQRDPYLVGASWGNQYPNMPEVEAEWFGQWKDWALILDMGPTIHRVQDFNRPKVKSKPDHKGLHWALERDRLDDYYKVVPREWIEFAQHVTREYFDD